MTELRHAQSIDVPQLEALIARSGRELSAGYYTADQAEAITRHVFGVDTQLIADQTYFVLEEERAIVACGGWSKRRTLFGGDQAKSGADPLLDPATEPARIRAFFVAPHRARRGLGRQLMEQCVAAAYAAGFRTLELVSTLPGEPLYLASGFVIVERFELLLPEDIRVPVSRMRRALGAPPKIEGRRAQDRRAPAPGPGAVTHVLFICSQNRLRSPTAEQVFASWEGIDVASAGLNNGADNPVTPELLAWAHLIFVMEKAHRSKLAKRFRSELKDKRVVCLDIPDQYDFMDPALVVLLEAKVPKHLPRL
jgi:predicted protein tyrosine phosphatase/GNAT superfamily N-acetyltransferase